MIVPALGQWSTAAGRWTMTAPRRIPPRKPTAVITSWTIGGQHGALCPDLLRIDQIGEADGWRGHLVRGFFRVLKWLTGV